MDTSAKSNMIINTNRREFEKQLMALDALSKLTAKFSKSTDFGHLIQVLLWTLSGQFSIANSFAIVKRPGARDDSFLYLGTGKLMNSNALKEFELSREYQEYFVDNQSIRNVFELELPSHLAGFVFIASECGLELICPLVNNKRFLGVIGLGKKVTKEAIDKQEIELISTLIQTVTPFLVNSYLFWEMATLKAWYVDILDSINQGIYVFDENNKLKKMNLAGFAILKSMKPTLPDINMMQGAPLELIFPDDIFSGWNKRLMALKNKNKRALIENMIARSDEIKKIFNVRLSLSINESQSCKDMIITLDDVTQQKENEEMMFNLEKLADKGSMASSIAHELNNFLGMIMGGAEITEVALKRDQYDKAENTLEKVKDNIMNMKRYTAGLMDYEKLKPSKSIADINKIISDVISFVSVQKKYRNLKINSEFDRNIIKFEMDKDQIAQVILNFMSNAADAIGEANRTDGIISIRTEADADNVVLIISDNGCGMPDEVKSELFENRLTTKESGHGHGLLTCGKILKYHNANVEVDSAPGKGTIFKITFTIQ